MATTQIKGNWDIEYTPQGGSSTVHTLAIPLRRAPDARFKNVRRKRRWEVWNDDFTEREVFTLGSTAVDEITVVIRMDDEPDLLKDMLTEALENDVTINIRPNGSGGTSYPCKVVRIPGASSGEIPVFPDRERYAYGEYEVPMVLRRVDGGTFEGLL